MNLLDPRLFLYPFTIYSMKNAPIFCKQKKELFHVELKEKERKKDDSAWFCIIFNSLILHISTFYICMFERLNNSLLLLNNYITQFHLYFLSFFYFFVLFLCFIFLFFFFFFVFFYCFILKLNKHSY